MKKRIGLLDLPAQHAPLRSTLETTFARVLESGHYILGPEVDAFEEEVARVLGVRHALGVSSGTDGLLLGLMALGLAPGDEVITTAFSFFATASSVLRLGAKPVFVDIDPETFLIDSEQVAQKVNARTRAILPVHLFGRVADVDALANAARGVPILEDAAQAFGASLGGRNAGSLGTLAAFSFFPSKNLGAFGDAGLVTTNDSELAERIRLLRHHGMKPKYVHHALGGNFRIDALQAALLRVKLPHVAGWNAARRVRAERYSERFSGTPVVAPRVSDGHIFHQFVIRVRERDALRAHLTTCGIESEVYYPVPLHRQPLTRGLGSIALPHSERAADEVLALPVHPELELEDVDRVADAVLEFVTTRGSRSVSTT